MFEVKTYDGETIKVAFEGIAYHSTLHGGADRKMGWWFGPPQDGNPSVRFAKWFDTDSSGGRTDIGWHECPFNRIALYD